MVPIVQCLKMEKLAHAYILIPVIGIIVGMFMTFIVQKTGIERPAAMELTK